MQILHICRSVVRQLGKPALLAATYKGDAAGIAFAAMEEVEGTLVNCLRELERLSLLSAGKHLSPFHCMYAFIFPSLCPKTKDPCCGLAIFHKFQPSRIAPDLP